MRPRLIFPLCCLAIGVLLTGATERLKKSEPVFSVREFNLKPSVKTEDFERFVRSEMVPVLAQEMKGLKIRVLKGDRGERRGAYYLIWEFDSVTSRNDYFPKEGGWTCGPAFDPTWKEIGPVMEKFQGLVKLKDGYTDYVELGD